MAHIFHKGEQEAQTRWETSQLWDKSRKEQLLWNSIPPEIHSKLNNAPFFFLATSDDKGNCDCSFKGGGPGLIIIIDDNHFAFQDYDGNGAFMSLGNILLNPNVGCLFIDFSNGERLRINGKAKIVEQGKMMKNFPNAKRIIVVNVELVVPNCSQHIPLLEPVAS